VDVENAARWNIEYVLAKYLSVGDGGDRLWLKICDQGDGIAVAKVRRFEDWYLQFGSGYRNGRDGNLSAPPGPPVRLSYDGRDVVPVCGEASQ
jgi:hypothetical protein